jgi:hypothetical protein
MPVNGMIATHRLEQHTPFPVLGPTPKERTMRERLLTTTPLGRATGVAPIPAALVEAAQSEP